MNNTYLITRDVNNEMTRILLIVHTNTYFPWLAQIRNILKRHGKYEPFFMFRQNFATLKRDIDICLKENLPYLSEPDIVISNVPNYSIKLSINILENNSGEKVK